MLSVVVTPKIINESPSLEHLELIPLLWNSLKLTFSPNSLSCFFYAHSPSSKWVKTEVKKHCQKKNKRSTVRWLWDQTVEWAHGWVTRGPTARSFSRVCVPSSWWLDRPAGPEQSPFHVFSRLMDRNNDMDQIAHIPLRPNYPAICSSSAAKGK